MQYRRCALIAAAVVATAATAMTFAAASSHAGGVDGNTPIRDVETSGAVSVNATFATDYRFRGFTQTREKSALQGGADVTWQHFYAGIWATNVDFGRELDAAGRWRDTADVEVVTYGGVKHKLFGGEVDMRAIYYAFPGSFGAKNNFGQFGDLDYFEVMAGVTREIFPSLSADLKIYYSPDYQGEVGRNWVFESGLMRKLGTYGSLAPSLSARLGHSAGDESKGGFDYWYWNAGFSLIFNQYFEFDLRYYDTFDVPTAIAGSCDHRCDGRVVARITFEN